MYNRLPKALVIDGQTLAFALDERLKVLFLEVARQCRSVICCRVTPLQKVRMSIVYVCLDGKCSFDVLIVP